MPHVSFSLFGLNWLDLVIIVVFLLYALEGYAQGFVAATFDLLSFIASFLLGLKFYIFVGNLLVHFFKMPQGFANALGFFLVAFFAEIICNMLLHLVLHNAARRYPLFTSVKPLSTLNKVCGIIPALFSATIILSFVLTLIISLPLSPFLKHAISSAKLGNMFVVRTQATEKILSGVFGGALKDTLTFLTIEPKSNESVALHFKTGSAVPDGEAEQQLLTLVNQERTSRGLPALSLDERLRDVARAHAKDMFARGYFSHYTPEGLSPFDRMAQANVQYTYAGENLALAPNVQLAHQGLMNSPGHKANILSPNFRKVGIGVMDGGIYGEMFAQEFTD